MTEEELRSFRTLVVPDWAFVGHIMGGVAKNNTTTIAGLAIIGFGARKAQLAALALPDFLPNKWRYTAIAVADWRR